MGKMGIMKTEEILQDLGLTKSKASVYFALLQAGAASAQDIAGHVEIPRTTAHEILQRLVSMGVVSFATVGRKRVYSAESPVKLEKILEEKQKKLGGIMPELLSLYDTVGARPQIRILEGVEGIKTVMEDTLTGEKEIFGILSMQDLYEVPGKKFIDTVIERRVNAGTHLNVIRSEEKEVEKYWGSSKKELRRLHYAPDDMLFPMTIYMYAESKVGIIGTRKENFGMIIESKDYYTTMKNMFDVMWQVTRVAKDVD